MGLHWEGVMYVRDDDDGIGRPTQAKANKDCEQRLGELHRLGPLFSGLRGWPASRHGDLPLGLVRKDEDLGVAGGDYDEWCTYPEKHEEQVVAVVSCSIPEACESLTIIAMPTESEEIGHLQEKTDAPQSDEHEDAMTWSVQFRVEFFVADVDVAINADTADAEKRTITSSQTETGHELA